MQSSTLRFFRKEGSMVNKMGLLAVPVIMMAGYIAIQIFIVLLQVSV